MFYYILNLQGNVLAIYNGSGTKVVRYMYDAWGNGTITSASNTALAHFNPFRYRGYVYDEETGLYYLQSRYYDPQTGRFISADSYLVSGNHINGTNMFAYCLNNPMMYVDPRGTDPGDLFDTKDQAAIDFANYIYFKSVEENIEYASVITLKIKVTIKKITIGNIILPIFVFGRFYTYKEPVAGTEDSSSFPINFLTVGLLHTHGAYSPLYDNENFSSQDKSVADFWKKESYVVTPLGTIRKYDPSDKRDYIIYSLNV